MELDKGDKQLLHRGVEQLTTANAIMRFLSDYFRDKYGLTPEHQITPDGRIVSTPITTLDGAMGISEESYPPLR